MIGFATVVNTLIALATWYYTVYGGFHRAHDALVLLQSAQDVKLSDEVVRELTEIAEKRIRGYVDNDAKERYRSYWWMMGAFLTESLLSLIVAFIKPLWSADFFGLVFLAVLTLGCAVAMPFLRRYVMKFEGRQSVKRQLSL